MNLEFYKPKSEILEKYIEGYYFISEDKNSKQIRYFTFPNNFSILSIHQNSKLQLEEKQFFISSSDCENIITDIVFRYSEPIEIIYENAVNEITIYFKPLGINHFFNSLDIFKHSKINDFNPFFDFKAKMKTILNDSDRESQIVSLENYWLSKFVQKNLTIIEQILLDVEADLKVEQIADKYGFSRQYIGKLFLKNMGKTPSEYRKIHRFRNSLMKHKKIKNLTQLSYENHFYDQSHFIKDFKALTNTKPILFFKNVDTEKNNVWFFV